jgi:hypothetical protein
MPYQNIDATISPADLQAIKDAFAAVLDKLPFLINLTAEERRATFKAGPDSVSFLTNSATAAHDNPSIFPGSFNTTGFQKDVDLFGVLTELSTLADSVASRIDDTRLAVGGEAMKQGSQVYKYVQTAAATTPGLKPVAEQLGERFKKASRPREQAEPGPSPAPRT